MHGHELIAGKGKPAALDQKLTICFAWIHYECIAWQEQGWSVHFVISTPVIPAFRFQFLMGNRCVNQFDWCTKTSENLKVSRQWKRILKTINLVTLTNTRWAREFFLVLQACRSLCWNPSLRNKPLVKQAHIELKIYKYSICQREHPGQLLSIASLFLHMRSKHGLDLFCLFFFPFYPSVVSPGTTLQQFYVHTSEGDHHPNKPESAET